MHYLDSFVSRGQRIYFFGILFLLVVFAIWHLAASPATWFDEGINLDIAQSLVQHGVYNLSVAPDQYVATKQFLITTNYPVLLPVALSLKLFGMNLAAARIPMVFFLILFIFAAYVLAKSLYGETAALWSIALMVSFVPLYGNGKDVLGEVPGLFFLLSGLLTLGEEWSAGYLFLAGAFFGLSIATKPFFLLLLPALAVGEYMRKKDFFSIELWRRARILAFGASVPLLACLFTILPQVSFSGVTTTIRYYVNSYASTHIGSLVLANALRFITETTPVHFLILATVTVGAACIRLRSKEAFFEGEIVLGSFIILNVLWYLKTPGWYRYFFPSHVLLFLFFPAALFSLMNRRSAIAILGLLLVVQTGYLLSRHSDPLYNSDEATQFAEYIRSTADQQATIFVANSPSVAFLLNGRTVFQYLQINPVLAFGDGRILSGGKARYDYVAVNRPMENILIPHFSDDLATGYMPMNTFGHFIFYKKRP